MLPEKEGSPSASVERNDPRVLEQRLITTRLEHLNKLTNDIAEIYNQCRATINPLTRQELQAILEREMEEYKRIENLIAVSRAQSACWTAAKR